MIERIEDFAQMASKDRADEVGLIEY